MTDAAEDQVETLIPVARLTSRGKDRERDKLRKTVPNKRINLDELERLRLEYSEDNSGIRPRTRGDCVGGMRPCPFVGCKHNLYLDVSSIGSIKFNFPELEPEEMKESCSLDIADRGGMTLQEVGDLFLLTRERARQIEINILRKLEANGLIHSVQTDGFYVHDRTDYSQE